MKYLLNGLYKTGANLGLDQGDWHSVHPPFGWVIEKVEPLTNFQKGGLDRISIFRAKFDGKEGDNFFQGGCSFYIKNKLKSDIFNEI